MKHSIRLIATLKGATAPSLDATDELDEAAYQRLSDRFRAADSSALAKKEEQARLSQMLKALAERSGTTQKRLVELYDFEIEIK